MNFRSSLRSIALFTLLAGLVSCNSAPANAPAESSSPATSEAAGEAADRPIVVATHSVLCDLTRQIAASTIDLRCMIDSGVDPHVYEPTPDARKAIDSAQLILYGGYNFEPSLIRLIQATSNAAPKVAVDEEAVPNPLRGEHEHEHEGEAHAEDEAPDPHVWHNAQNGIQIAEVISRNLSQLSLNNAQLYAQNAEKVTAELAQIDTWIKSQIETIPAESRKLVTTHDALGYYAEAYGLPIAGALSGLSTEEAPTPQQVGELVSEIKTAKVPTIFAETSVNPRLIETVAREANVQVSEQELFADGLGNPGSEGDTYQKMLIANTEAIVEGLGGQVTPFRPQTSALPTRQLAAIAVR